MRVKSHQQADVTIVNVRSRLTGANVPSGITGKIIAVGAQPVKLLLNLEKVRGINSAGFGVIREVAYTVEQNGGRIAVMGVQRLGNLMATLKMRLRFACYEREEEAIASFHESGRPTSIASTVKTVMHD